MPTDPLTASRYPAATNSPNVPQDIQNAVFDLSDNTTPFFTSTTARDTAYTAWVAQGGVMRDGLFCYVNAVGRMVYVSGAWERDGAPPAHALLHGVSTQSLVNNSPTTITLGTQVRATRMTTTVGTGRINVSVAGIYLVSGMASFDINTTGRRMAAVMLNGTVVTQTANTSQASDGPFRLSTSTYPLSLVAGDFLQLQAYQQSGGALNVDRSESFLQASLIARV